MNYHQQRLKRYQQIVQDESLPLFFDRWWLGSRADGTASEYAVKITNLYPHSKDFLSFLMTLDIPKVGFCGIMTPTKRMCIGMWIDQLYFNNRKDTKKGAYRPSTSKIDARELNEIYLKFIVQYRAQQKLVNKENVGIVCEF